jgi:hypothetical protein
MAACASHSACAHCGHLALRTCQPLESIRCPKGRDADAPSARFALKKQAAARFRLVGTRCAGARDACLCAATTSSACTAYGFPSSASHTSSSRRRRRPGPRSLTKGSCAGRRTAWPC